MTSLHKSRPLVWGIFIVFCIVWLYTLAPRTLVPTNEGRYAEMAREMATTGDWITPRLNGIKHFENPPLQIWMTAISFKAFGLGAWQARLWSGLCGLFGILLVAYAGSRVFNQRVGFTAGVVLASSFMWGAAGHFNSLDMGFSAMLALALCALLLAQRPKASSNQQRNWMLAAWAGMALAVLAKGLAGILLPGAVLLLYSLATRDWQLWRRLHVKKGMLLFLGIAAPWFILVSWHHPEFAHFFFIHEHFTPITTRLQHRLGPWHYFIPYLLLGLLPWLGVLGQSLWRARREPAKGFKPRKVLLIWTGLLFFIFSISNAKLPTYIVPIFPAAALLIACYLQNASTRTLMWAAALVAALSAIGLLFSPQIPARAGNAFEEPLYQAYAAWVMAAAMLGTIGSLAAAWLARRRAKEWSIVMLGATAIFSGQLLMLGHEPIGAYAAGTPHLQAIQAELSESTPIYAVGRYEYVLPFYLQRSMTLVAHADEMAFGLRQEPGLWIPTIDGFVDTWQREHVAGLKALAILSPPMYQALQARALPMRVIAQDPRRVIVASDLKLED